MDHTTWNHALRRALRLHFAIGLSCRWYFVLSLYRDLSTATAPEFLRSWTGPPRSGHSLCGEIRPYNLTEFIGAFG